MLSILQVNEARNQDLFQHMKDDDSSNHDAQTLDSATADQVKEQEKANFPAMQSEHEEEEEDSEIKTALLEENEQLSVSVPWNFYDCFRI